VLVLLIRRLRNKNTICTIVMIVLLYKNMEKTPDAHTYCCCGAKEIELPDYGWWLERMECATANCELRTATRETRMISMGEPVLSDTRSIVNDDDVTLVDHGNQQQRMSAWQMPTKTINIRYVTCPPEQKKSNVNNLSHE
jgi:hypothetical protein